MSRTRRVESIVIAALLLFVARCSAPGVAAGVFDDAPAGSLGRFPATGSAANPGGPTAAAITRSAATGSDGQEQTAPPASPATAATPAATTMPAASPVPDAASRRRAAKLVQDVFGAELARAKQPPDRSALAARLMQAGLDERKDLAARYVLFSLALDKAAEAGNAAVAFRAADKLAGSFAVDVLKLKADAAIAAGHVGRSPQDEVAFVATLDPLIGQCMAADRYDLALRLGNVSLASARAAADPALGRQAAARLQEVRSAEAAYVEANAAAELLRRKPTDPEANLTLGKFRCLVKGDWPHGLPLLIAGSDSALKRLALLETAGATSADAQVALGDGWWDEGERLADPGKLAARRHAAEWYSRAVAALDKGLLRDKLELRINAVAGPTSGQFASAGGTRASEASTAAPPTPAPLALTPDNLSSLESMTLARPWDRARPKTTLDAQRVEGSLVLGRANSPYLVTGMLLVAPGATLTIQPGAVVLFGPQVKLQVEGTLNATSDDAWIVLAGSDPKARWGGVECNGKAGLRRCLIAGAQLGISQPRGDASLAECVFFGDGNALDVGNNGRAAAHDCLFLRNELGVIAHGDGGNARLSRCLLLFNERGCTANFYGRCEVSNCTFYGNQIAIQAAERGNGVRVNLSNVLAVGGGRALGSRGGKVVAAGNYWGKQGPPNEAGQDCSGPLSTEAKDALPKLPACEFLTNDRSVPQPGGAAARAGTTPSAVPRPFVPIDAAVGGWLRSYPAWFVALLPDGRLVAQGYQATGRWHLTTTSLVIQFDDGVHGYTFDQRPVDGKLAGRDQDGHAIEMTRIPFVPSGTKPFLPVNAAAGTWTDGAGKQFVLAPNGLFAYDGKPLGIWQDKADAIVLQFIDGRIDSYTTVSDNKLSGTSSIGHAVAIRKMAGR